MSQSNDPEFEADTAPRLFALVPAAGSGSRSGAAIPKQYVRVAGASVIAHTLRALLAVPQIIRVLVVLAPDDEMFEKALDGPLDPRCMALRLGGASRAETVANGLQAMRHEFANEHDWVLVHDAARCLLQPHWVDRLIQECLLDDVGGLLAMPIADTLKQSIGGRVGATLDRSDKWAAQTPQMFRVGPLQHALCMARAVVTDEASAMEAIGLQPRLVLGHATNLKLTWPDDFELAEQLLMARKNQ